MALLLALAPVSLHAQVPSLYKITKITPSFIPTPQYQIQGEQRADPNQQAKWPRSKSSFNLTPSNSTPEMTFSYYVMFNGIVLAGEVTHVNVLKGRELYSVMYIPPRTIASLLKPGIPPTPALIQDIGVVILIKASQVAELSGGACPAQVRHAADHRPLAEQNQTLLAPLYWGRYASSRPPPALTHSNRRISFLIFFKSPALPHGRIQ